MKRLLALSVFLFFSTQLAAYPPMPQPRNEEETLFLRRVFDFWKDKEYGFVKSELYNYLQRDPRSPFADHFHVLLGDIALHAKNYEEALLYYARIGSKEIKDEVQPKKWQSLYQLKRYSQLHKELAPELGSLSNEGHFYLAEAAFRHALELKDDPLNNKQVTLLLHEALSIYGLLSEDSTFKSHTKLSIGEINRLLNKSSEATQVYAELVDTEKDEEILLHAASLLVDADPKRALRVFEKLASAGTKKQAQAAHHLLELLVKEKNFEALKSHRSLLISSLEKKELPLMHFYMGILAYEHQEYLQAVQDLLIALKGGVEKKAGFLALLVSGKEAHELAACEWSFAKIQALYPEELIDASCLLAAAYQCEGVCAKGIALLETLSSQEGAQERLSFEKIRLYAVNHNYPEAHTAADQFLERFPHSEKRLEVERLAVHFSLAELNQGGSVYGELSKDLERALHSNIFSGSEKKEMQYVLAKSYLKLNRISEATALLHTIPDCDPLLLTQCYVKAGDTPQVIVYAEQALKQTPENAWLHLHLFNAYLELSKLGDTTLTEKAAAHLDAVIDTYPVSLENRLWLTHYFAKQAHPRAVVLLERLLQGEGSWRRFDEEAFLLATLYYNQGKLTQAASLFENIATLSSPNKLRAELYLADILRDRNELHEAYLLYRSLEESANPAIALAARLQSALISFTHSPETSLKRLEEIKMRKTLALEPVHLEAALEYAVHKAELSSLDQQQETLLALLQETKAEFTSQTDIASKDYHASRDLYPDKDLIYQAYMRYIDAKISLIESRLTSRVNREESQLKKETAQALFASLKEGKFAVSKYLIEKATEGLHEE